MSESDPLGLVGRTIEELRFDDCVDTEGEGLVYRGKLSGREGSVAIKCLSLSRLGTSDMQARALIAARFNEETKTLRKLADGQHDIVQLVNDGRLSAPTNGETVQYQVLEWLDGRTLQADLEERRSRGMPGRSLRETMDLLESGALAMGHAHASGVVHRDLQPSNFMMVRQRGAMRLKVLNFGLAKTMGRDAVIGSDVATFTQEYGAPEVVGEPPGEIGPWTDVWSLAIILLELLTGQAVANPQQGGLRASALGVQGVPPTIDDALAKATALDPRARFADARAFWATLREGYQAAPKQDMDALAATALDDDAQAAIARMRAMTAGSGGANVPQSDKGTMLMAAAPPQPQPAIPIQEGPLAGTKPVAIPSPLASSLGGHTKTPLRAKGTAPMPAQMPLAATPPGPLQHVAMPTPAPPPQPQVAIEQPTAKPNMLAIGIIAAVLVLIVIFAVVVLVIH
jgi:serine/threonine-protein kinase